MANLGIPSAEPVEACNPYYRVRLLEGAIFCWQAFGDPARKTAIEDISLSMTESL